MNEPADYRESLEYIDRRMRYGGLIGAIIEHTREDIRDSAIRVVEELEAKDFAWGRACAETTDREEGRLEGHAELLLWQLEHRFGSLPFHLKTKVLGAPPLQVRSWALRLLTASSLDEALGAP
jgi:hypothetical protein